MRAPHRIVEPLEARIALAFAADIGLADLDGFNGFKLSGVAAGDYASRVRDAGDVNGDGFADVIIGASGADPHGKESGLSYVVFGKRGGFAPNVELAALNGRNGFVLVGEAEYDRLGYAVSGAGDINGDGFADLLVGAPLAHAAYLVFGKAAGFSPRLQLSALDGTNGCKLRGYYAGVSVSGAGDVNGDGFDDLIVGANANPYAAYVLLGKAENFAAEIDLPALNGTDGFILVGNSAGDSVGAAGDFNADGFADLIVGGPFSSPHGDSSGAAYVVFGKATGFTANIELSNLDGTDGFKLSGEAEKDFAGRSVSGAGDINGDGFADIIVGAPGAVGASGTGYVVFGTSGAVRANIDLSSLDGNNGFKLRGEKGYDQAGLSVSGLDFNGDGFDDVIIGAHYNALGRGQAAYVVFGKADGFPATLELGTLNGGNGFRVNGVKADGGTRHYVSGAGDFDRDGFPDLIIGTGGADPHGDYTGAAYIIFGGRDPGRLRITADGLSASYTDPEGDFVTVTSAGRLRLEMFEMRAEGLGFLLETLTMTNTGMVKDIALSAQRQDANHDGILDGNGRVNVGAINAVGIDLGKVRVKGDLGQMDAGDNDPSKAAISLLKVRSLGARGTTTQDPAAPSLHSDIAGDLKTLIVKADVSNGVTLAVQGRIGSATIGGDLDNSTISVLGTLIATNPKQNVALQSLIIGGNVTGSRILGGYDAAGAANPDATIGLVRVGGTWAGSDLVCGVADTSTPGDLNSPPDGFGRNDTLIAGGSGIAEIARVIIKGSATGSSISGTDHFGITAELITQVKINGVALALTSGKEDLVLDPTNDDFRLVEL